MTDRSEPFLPPLPDQMRGRPFGLDEQGRPIRGVTGATFEPDLAALGARARRQALAGLPADTPVLAAERLAAAAAEASYARLVERLNAAMPDPRYQVTLEALRRPGNAYSLEFSVYLTSLCQELSGDPHFHRTKFLDPPYQGPAALRLLLRALPLPQAYRFFPVIVARLADTRLEAGPVTARSAIFRWRAAAYRGQLPAELWPRFLATTRGGFQGVLACLPSLHSGWPVATIVERRSLAAGDDCDEWEFRWAPYSASPLSEPDPPLAAAAIRDLPPLPAQMRGPVLCPGGQASFDGYSAGVLVDYLLECVQRQTTAAAPAGLEPVALAGQVAADQAAALDTLIERLNAALPPNSQPVTAQLLRHNPGGRFSLEFAVYLQTYAAELARDPHFHFQRGTRSQYPFLLRFLAALPLAQAYQLIPALAARLGRNQMETTAQTATSIIIRWRLGPELESLPADLVPAFIRVACPVIQGVLSHLPVDHSGLPPARVKEWRCLLAGDNACEWEITWQDSRPRSNWLLLAGLVLSLATAMLWWQHNSLFDALSLLLAAVPALASLLLAQMRRAIHDRREHERLLAEQREQTARHYDEVQRSSQELQLANLSLGEKVSELSALRELSEAIGASLNLEELLARSLHTFITRLGFDRALIALVDESRQTLGSIRLAGGDPELAAYLGSQEVPLNGLSPVAQVARTGQPVIVRDLTQVRDERARAGLIAMGLREFMAVPLMVAGRVIGVLAADQSRSGRPLTSAALESLLAAGRQLANAVDRARLYQTLEQRVEQRTAEVRDSEARYRALFESESRHARELALLERVRQALGQELELDAFLRTMVEAVADLLGYTQVSVYMLGPAGLSLQHQVGYATPITLIPLDQGVMSRAVQTGQAILLDDAGADPAFIGAIQDVTSEICVPLRDGDQVVGALNVESVHGVRLGPDDLRMMRAVGESASIALRNARLFAQAQQELRERQRAEASAHQRAAELEALYATLTDITAELSLPRLLRTLLLRALALVNADTGELGLYDAERREIEIVVSYNMGRDYAGTRLALGEGAMGQVAATGQPLIISDYTAWAGRSGQYNDLLPHAVALLPLLSGVSLRGVIAVADHNVHRVFSAEDLRRVELFARQAVIAINNAQLFQAAARAAERRASLYQASQEIRAGASPEEIAQAVHRAAGQLMPVESVVIARLRPDQRTVGFEYLWDAGRRWPAAEQPLTTPSLASHIIRTGLSLRVDNINDPAIEAQTGATTFGEVDPRVCAALAVPLHGLGGAQGMLSVQSYAPTRYTAEDQELLEMLAAYAATAYENAHLLEEARRRATEAETLRQAGLVVTATLDQPAAIERLLIELQRVVPHDSASVQLLRHNELEIVGGRGWRTAAGDLVDLTGMRFPVPGDNPNTLVIQSGQPLVLADSLASYATFRDSPLAPNIRGWLGAPLLVRDRVIGMLVLDSRQPDHFTARHVELVTALAAQMAAALDNVHLYKQTALAAERRATLLRASREINASVDQEQICAAIHRACAAVMPLDFIAISLLTDDRAELEDIYAVEGAERSPYQRRPAGSGLLGYVIAHREALIRVDYDEDELVSRYGAAITGDPALSLLAVPIQSGADILGALTVQSERPHAYTPEDLELLELLAAQAAIAFENARLFAAARRAAARREALLRASQALNLAADQARVLEAVRTAAGRLMPVDFILIGLLTPDQVGIDLVYAVGPAGPLPTARLLPASQGVLGAVIRRGRPLRLDNFDAAEARRLRSQPLTDQLPRSIIAVPLRGGEALAGAVSVQSLQARAYTADDVELLELLAAQAGVALQNARLLMEARTARQAAEAANAAKSTFLANVSHELRTPLNGVIGMTSLLADTPLTARQRDFVGTIRASGDTLLTLINDLLDLSKIESGRLELERRAFDLRACVEAALDVVAPRAAEKGLALAALLEPGLPAGIEGDETRLRQILVNLLGNGVKFTEAGEVTVTVMAEGYGVILDEAAGPPDFDLHLVVRDTGPGIPAERQPLLFRSFSQLDPSITRRYGGTGLGLAISRALVEQMGGRIWVESGADHPGSAFHFTLRVQAAPPPAPEPLLEAAILIAEPHAFTRQALTFLTQGWGLQPVTAATGLEVLARLGEPSPPRLAIIDASLLVDIEPILRQATAAGRLAVIQLAPLGRPAGPAAAPDQLSLTKPVKAAALRAAVAGLLHGSPPVAADQPAREPAVPAPSLRLLVAEDNEINQRLALLMLERLGYRADLAVNGREALAALRRQPYDLIFMDVQMPEMDGLEATRRIRAEFERQPVIIALTANAMAEDRQVCLAAGMDDFLAKPFQREDLQATLARWGGPAGPASLAPPLPERVAPLSGQLAQLRAELGVETVQALLEKYEERLPALLAQMTTALAERQAAPLAAAAHALKGSSASLGVHEVETLARALETHARAGQWDAAARLVAEMPAAQVRLRRALAGPAASGDEDRLGGA